ncbi:hypothetical protein PsorP6_017813 [Peronosclerospora sorghi]|uniref:Uncharacterized protein n=1 Tax=Peronosclerospora sorghi TaxID=230839 RepID=A0ACC0WCN2_9STRA|nr:hypothetical protein PsorP6_017813 [Peronosclerospora sorghi]
MKERKTMEREMVQLVRRIENAGQRNFELGEKMDQADRVVFSSQVKCHKEQVKTLETQLGQLRRCNGRDSDAVNGQDTTTQYTQELLAAWVAHSTWPVLHVRFYQSLALYRAVERQLRTVANASTATNVDLVCDAAANATPELVRLKNAIGMHVMPAPPELEEYEDVVLETLAVGGGPRRHLQVAHYAKVCPRNVWPPRRLVRVRDRDGHAATRAVATRARDATGPLERDSRVGSADRTTRGALALPALAHALLVGGRCHGNNFLMMVRYINGRFPT